VIGAGHEVRRATPDERAPLAAALARAFHDDPVMSWFFPDEDRREAQNRRFFAMRLRQLVPQGETYTAQGHGGAALWTVPGAWHLSNLETFRMGVALARALGRRMGTILKGVETIERAHPRAPHYYLAVLGTEPARQGQGLGSALIQPVLDGCDRDDVPAYLESSKERNVDFYARHGFRVTGEIVLPDGPTVWPMWREPRA
jgi:GNAT superfamily N-acetyltransferase